MRLIYVHFKDGLKVSTMERRPSKITHALDGQLQQQTRKIPIEEDSRLALCKIEEETLLCRGTVETIIHQHLKVRKLPSRWIPRDLTNEQKKARVSICKANIAKIEERK
jgi:hypothetical protein